MKNYILGSLGNDPAVQDPWARHNGWEVLLSMVTQAYFINIHLGIHLELLEEINRRLLNKMEWGGSPQPLKD